MGHEPATTRRILLVEDEAPLRRILTMNLAHLGYSVAEADSVESADEALHAATDVVRRHRARRQPPQSDGVGRAPAPARRAR